MMALQTVDKTTFCYCGDSTRRAVQVDTTDCNLPCSGNPGVLCGAPLRNSVYSLHPGDGINGECWDGSLTFSGKEVSQRWHQYRGCAVCGPVPLGGEKWQLWGKEMTIPAFAACLSCKPGAAFVMTDPHYRQGYCRDFNPATDAVTSFTYPYFAHWDGRADFVHTKFMLKYVVPKVRSGKAVATCKLWKQVRCEENVAARLRSWRKDSKDAVVLRPEPVERYMECHISKTVECAKVCVANSKNLGRNPEQKQANCGFGSKEVKVEDKGLVAELGKEAKGLNGIWCCSDGCKVPPEHTAYREDPGFWCKDELLTW